VRAVESHRFDRLTRLRFRSSALDFSSIAALIASLRRPPPHELLRLDLESEDLAALVALGNLPEIQERARGADAVRLLWDICRVPDYRKLLFESHVALLAALFTQLAEGRVDTKWVEQRIREVDDNSGDIDTLTARLAAVRTWSYVANQSGWLPLAHEWQERTRAVEDRLSDALHQKLIQRFVERTQKRVVLGKSIEVSRAPRIDPAHPFAKLLSMRNELAGEPSLTAEDDFIEGLIDAPHARFAVQPSGHVTFDGARVALLTRGATLLTPDVRLWGHSDLAPGARTRVMRRLVAFARDYVDELIGPLRALAPELAAAGRGLVYQLEQSLGTVLTSNAEAQIAALTPEERAVLERHVRFGARVTFAPALLDAAAMRARTLLVSLYFDEAPRAHGVSFAAPRADPHACLALGYPVFAKRAIRADALEDVIAEADSLSLDDLAERLACPKREVMRIAEAIAAG